MSDVLRTGLGWALVVGFVAAVWLGRRRGRAYLASQVAAAHAQGFAEGGKAAATAAALQSVAVNVATGGVGGAGEGGEAHWCVDPMECPRCGPVLLRVARQSLGAVNVDSTPAYGTPALDRPASHDTDERRLLGVPVAPDRHGESARRAGGRVADPRHVRADASGW